MPNIWRQRRSDPRGGVFSKAAFAAPLTFHCSVLRIYQVFSAQNGVLSVANLGAPCTMITYMIPFCLFLLWERSLFSILFWTLFLVFHRSRIEVEHVLSKFNTIVNFIHQRKRAMKEREKSIVRILPTDV